MFRQLLVLSFETYIQLGLCLAEPLNHLFALNWHDRISTETLGRHLSDASLMEGAKHKRFKLSLRFLPDHKICSFRVIGILLGEIKSRRVLSLVLLKFLLFAFSQSFEFVCLLL